MSSRNRMISMVLPAITRPLTRTVDHQNLASRCCARVVCAAVLAGAFASPSSNAADVPHSAFPQRPLRFVSPFAAGGTSDIIGRLIALRFTEDLGQFVVVENRPGAGGRIGNAHVAHATPDGHTLLVASGAFTAIASVGAKLNYDSLGDFAWVGRVVRYPLVILTHPNSALTTTAGLIEQARKQPGKLNYGSVGVGSGFQLAAELFNAMARTEIAHVPYKGSTELATEVLGGRLDIAYNTIITAYPHVKSGRLHAVAVTSRDINPLLPTTPPVAQSLPGYEMTSFMGLAVPRKTPRTIVLRLHRSLTHSLAHGEVQSALLSQGGSIDPAAPDEMNRYVADEIAKWTGVATERAIRIP